ncbi:FdhD [Acrasis kona]|uniref:FdhD n=1 Tax=Acrasis kona TaxID=1008807 RepID=A0AAW2YMY9_9EUKA
MIGTDNGEAISWVQSFQQEFEKLQAEELVTKFFSPSAQLRSCNDKELVGRDSILQNYKNTFPLMKSIRHKLNRVDVCGDVIYAQSMVTYVVVGDSDANAIELPSLAVFERPTGQEQLTSLELFMDLSPAIQRLATVISKK